MIKIEDCVHDRESAYVLKSVNPKKGELRGIHMDMKVGGVWLLGALQPGRVAVGMFERNCHPGYMYPVSLSKIESVACDGNTMTVTTKNTVYVFSGGV